MLQSIRDRLTGPTVWVAIGLISIPFAFWGIESFSTAGGDPVVAKIGDQDITQRQFQQAYEQRYQQYRSLLGENFRADLFDQNQFRQAILDDMVQESALRQFASDSGYRASDATLRDFLISIPAFQTDGQFSVETYRSLLQRQDLNPERYEAQVRESLVIEQLRGAVQETAFVTPAEAWESYRLENQARKIVLVTVAAKDFRDQVKVSDEQIASRYETDKAQYMSAERIKLAYVELDRTRMTPADEPSAEAIKAIYDAEKDARFTSAEERRASHILIAFGADKEGAKKKAQDLVTQLAAGGDFAKLAEANSEDSGSKVKGGDLGWIRKGTMVPRFEEALFGLGAGAIAGPVETEFGWHIIRLEEVKAATVRALEDPAVQAELLEAYRAREVDRRFQELSSNLEQLAFEKSTLEPVAQELGLTVQTTDWFSRGAGTGIAALDAVRQAAFSPEILTDDENSKPLVASTDALVVIRKSEYQAARQKPIEEVRDAVREVLVTDGAAALAKAAADALVASARGGQSLAEAAAAKGLPVQFEGEARRRQAGIDSAVLDAVFKQARPDGASQLNVVVTGGDAVVAELSAVIDPERPADDDDRRKAALDEQRARLRDSVAGAEFSAYRQSIESEISVKIVNPPTAATAGESADF